MALTPAQRKILERYQVFRDTPPKVWSLWVLNSQNQAIRMIVTALASIYMYLEASPSAGCCLACFGLGTIIRDFAWFRATTRAWTVLSHVMNWQKIDDLLAGREDLESES